MENIVEIPKIRTVQGGQTTESLGAALVRHVAQTEIVEDVEIGACLPTESAHSNVRHRTHLGVSPVVVVKIQPVPVVKYVTPIPAVTYLSTRLQHPPFLAFFQLPQGQWRQQSSQLRQCRSLRGQSWSVVAAIDKVVDILVVAQRQTPMVRAI